MRDVLFERAAFPRRRLRDKGFPLSRKRPADLGRDDRSMSPVQVLAFIQGEQSKWGPIVQQIAAQTQSK